LWEGAPEEDRLRVGEVAVAAGAINKGAGAAVVGTVVALHVVGVVQSIEQCGTAEENSMNWKRRLVA
jgi:hypothetical protein